MDKEKRPFCYHKMFVPNGLSAPAWGYIHVKKYVTTVKKSIKIYRRLPLCRLRVSRYYHLCRSDFSFLTFFLYKYLPFKLCVCRKRLTWSNGYLEVIFHTLDVFSIIFATSYVEVKNRRSHECRIVCFSYVHVLSEVPKSSKWISKTIKVIYLLSIEQLILYLVQLNPWLFWYEIILNTNKA